MRPLMQRAPTLKRITAPLVLSAFRALRGPDPSEINATSPRRQGMRATYGVWE